MLQKNNVKKKIIYTFLLGKNLFFRGLKKNFQ